MDEPRKSFLVFGQENIQRTDLPILIRKTANIFRQINESVIVRETNLSPLSWAIEVEVLSEYLYSYSPSKVMEYLKVLFNDFGHGKYYLRGHRQKPDSIWSLEADEERRVVRAFFSGIPLSFVVEEEANVIQVSFDWITKAIRFNFPSIVPAMEGTSYFINGLPGFMGIVSSLGNLEGDWFLEVIFEEKSTSSKMHTVTKIFPSFFLS